MTPPETEPERSQFSQSQARVSQGRVSQARESQARESPSKEPQARETPSIETSSIESQYSDQSASDQSASDQSASDQSDLEHQNLDQAIQEIVELHASLAPQIEPRLRDFQRAWEEGDDEGVFRELVFCLLTPQSRARSCWAAVESLTCQGLVMEGRPEEIHPLLKGVRFKYRKSEYVCLARETFSRDGKLAIKAVISSLGDPAGVRDWLVTNVFGMGYKEASHFLRNVGMGRDLSILDRHILKNLVRLQVIDEIPSSLTRKTYLGIEERMREFAARIGVPLDHLDLVLWYRQAGEIFK
ncbi:MAG: N-glycosylase/DNA lyase [Methanosarcinales archaeon]|nr:N-glycosylase/DNA lyase [Methanosarcinales archaeon]